MRTSRTPFGRVAGTPVDLFTLDNGRGMTARITNLGGTITSLVVPDAHGGRSDIVCGFDRLEGYASAPYVANAPYFGCLVGRYAMFIKDGKFTVDGRVCEVSRNAGSHHLHGGIHAFDKRVWDARVADTADTCAVEMKLVSPDGDEGYPGKLAVSVEYRLTPGGELRIRYRARTDRATPVSLTNHTYFNLNGFRDTILDHDVRIAAGRTLVPDESGVPAGAPAEVAGTVLDLTRSRRLGDVFRELPGGFVHYFVFNRPAGTLAKVAEFSEPISGRRLEVLTTEPGAFFYTGLYTAEGLAREDGTRYGKFRGFCFETGKYSNGPNIAGAPGSILHPGEAYDETTVFKFIADTPPAGTVFPPPPDK